MTEVIDEVGDAQFCSKLSRRKTIYQKSPEQEEVHIKNLIEKAQPSHERILVYTRSKKEALNSYFNAIQTNSILTLILSLGLAAIMS